MCECCIGMEDEQTEEQEVELKPNLDPQVQA